MSFLTRPGDHSSSGTWRVAGFSAVSLPGRLTAGWRRHVKSAAWQPNHGARLREDGFHADGARARISWGGSDGTGCWSLATDEWNFVIRDLSLLTDGEEMEMTVDISNTRSVDTHHGLQAMIHTHRGITALHTRLPGATRGQIRVTVS